MKQDVDYEYTSIELCVARARQEIEVNNMATDGWRLVAVTGNIFWFERSLDGQTIQG